MSNNIFAEIAKRETNLSPVLQGRTKVSVSEIMSKYPGGVTIVEFDLIRTRDKQGEESEYPVLAIEEDSSVCFFGGFVLHRIVKEWVALYSGDVAEASKSLAEAGGVKIKMHERKTKSGNNITTVEVVG